MPSVKNILDERGEIYGEFLPLADVTQAIKRAYVRGDRWRHLAADQKEALELIATKVARIVSKSPDHTDSWADIAGYATLVAERLDYESPLTFGNSRE